jgi:hypothetical protein
VDGWDGGAHGTDAHDHPVAVGLAKAELKVVTLEPSPVVAEATD